MCFLNVGEDSTSSKGVIEKSGAQQWAATTP